MVRINWNQFFLIYLSSTRVKSATVEQLPHQLSHPPRQNRVFQEENKLGTGAAGDYHSNTKVRCHWSELGKLHVGQEHKVQQGTKHQTTWATSTFFYAIYQLDPRSVWVSAITKVMSPVPAVGKLHLAWTVHDFSFKKDDLCSSHLVLKFCWSVLIFISHMLSPSFTLYLLSHGSSARSPQNHRTAPQLHACTQCQECQTWRANHSNTLPKRVMFMWLNRCMSICAGNLTLWVLLSSSDVWPH